MLCHTAPSRRIAHAVLIALCFAASCKVGPNYEKPTELPTSTWTQSSSASVTPSEPELNEWWKRFDDPILDQLVAQAQESNATLEQSLANVRVAFAALGISESEYWPSISTAILYERHKTNVSQLAAQGVVTAPYNQWALGAAMASWEIDLWGRVARTVESSKASLESQVEDLRDALVSIRSQVGMTYMQVRTTQLQIAIAEMGADNLRQTLEMTTQKFRAGTTTLLDVNQSQTDLDMQLAKIPTLEANLAASIFSLAQLCGTTPAPMIELLGKVAPIPSGPATVGVGIPADLLRRRSDVRSSERLAAAAVATIGATEALNLPVFALAGNFYLASNQFSGLGSWSNNAYSFGPTVSWLVFQGGYVNSMIAQSKGQAQAALANYRNTVLSAIQDVETCISALTQSQETTRRYQTAVNSAQQTYDLGNLQYQAGTIDLENLLSIQNILLDAQTALAQSQGYVAQNIVNLYRALGGGWESSSVNMAADEAAKGKGSS
ncbi:MAG: TolC family protein [Phycisphaerales bacterium]|nr:TolC family protein [Phycisphaerales bacterium]